VVVASEGPTGAAVIVRPTDNERMLQAARLLARRLQLTGFFGLDFMIEDGTGIPYLIELNPRCTQLGHLEMPAQGSLAGVFSATWRGEPRPDPERPIRANTIALFPQALAAGAACSQYIETSYHDLPSDQPALIRELLLEPWPQRQWMALLYHAFRPVRRPEPVQFERPASPGAAQRSLGVTAASPAFDFPS